jgi:hypothetical protein
MRGGRALGGERRERQGRVREHDLLAPLAGDGWWGHPTEVIGPAPSGLDELLVRFGGWAQRSFSGMVPNRPGAPQVAGRSPVPVLGLHGAVPRLGRRLLGTEPNPAGGAA